VNIAVFGADAIHFAEQRSAQYSMSGRKHSTFFDDATRLCAAGNA
jgi:hypothetical protein